MIGKILNRLESVRRTGEAKWIARCPAHQDSTPSLSLREESDGTVLIHCFAGCGTADVMNAVGLTLADLFDRPATHRTRPIRPRVDYRAILRAVAHEALVIELAAGDLANARPLSPVGLEVVQRAVGNIQRIAGRWA